ncbi:endo alpha-1,4 polygalactosaminidase [Umezawaea sp. NPDC059074]|uniref:endo alpha-1,4 polygalactosaminidase n=1 Tax=Umezawaea sp. NPDC059074 TaxID=3346716 RepID=UPI0036AB2888
MTRTASALRKAALACTAVVLTATATQAQAAPSATAAVQLPPTPAVLDYQLGAAYTPPSGVTLVTRDSTATPAPGIYNICYVNGFQTQPEEKDLWLKDRKDLLLTDSSGKPIIDPDWPDEFILDTSTATKRTRLADITGTVIQRCAQKGFKAVEIDNLDSYSRSRGKLTASNNLAYATLLATKAHTLGLAIGQKNSAEESARARSEVGFDFAFSEECHAYDECSMYSDVYGTHVMDVEYTDNLRGTFTNVCRDPQTPKTTTLRDRYLVGPGNSAYRYQHC